MSKQLIERIDACITDMQAVYNSCDELAVEEIALHVASELAECRDATRELLAIVRDILPDDHSDYGDGRRCDECGMPRERPDQTECENDECYYVRIRAAIAKAEGRT